MRIRPQPLSLVRQTNGRYRLQSDWNLTDWAVFRAMPSLLILGAAIVFVLILGRLL